MLERIADITQSLHYSDYIPTPTFMRTTLNCHPGFSNRHQFLKPGLKKVKTPCAWNRVALLSELDFPISPQQYQVIWKKARDQLYLITYTSHSWDLLLCILFSEWNQPLLREEKRNFLGLLVGFFLTMLIVIVIAVMLCSSRHDAYSHLHRNR